MAAKTALNVLPAISFPIDLSVILSILWVVVLIFLSFTVKKAKRKFLATLSVITVISSVIIIFSLFLPNENRDNFWDTVSASRKNGFLFSFISNTRILHNPAPDNYDTDNLLKIISDDSTKTSDARPNIIVIMNEAFSDSSRYSNLKTNRDPLEFFHNFNEGTKGDLIVSVFGGGTCNTEYDFLTGNSSFMLRNGSYPMQQFVSQNSPSIASTLKAQGYATTAIHPYYANGWNRNRAYPLLGFDNFISLEDFSEPEIMRQFVSDKCAYEKIIETTETSSAPQFIFCVTMQNHLGYDISYENFKEEVTFPKSESFPQTRQYLSLIKESDEALKDLIEYYKTCDTPTYILFFGDHQPAIDDGFFEKTVSENDLDRYTVPFLLWCNKKDVKLDIRKTSPNFLGSLLLKTIGLKTTYYDKYLLKLMEEIPVISAQGIRDADGNFFSLNSENTHKNSLNFYHALQYNQVFDMQNRIDKLFFIK